MADKDFEDKEKGYKYYQWNSILERLGQINYSIKKLENLFLEIKSKKLEERIKSIEDNTAKCTCLSLKQIEKLKHSQSFRASWTCPIHGKIEI